jgi:hypothetical protein
MIKEESGETLLKEAQEQSQFEWNMPGVLEEGRPDLGPMTDVAV